MTLRHTEALALSQGVETVSVAVAAAVPEARASPLIAVKVPSYGVVLAAAGVRAQETGVWMKTGERD